MIAVSSKIRAEILFRLLQNEIEKQGYIQFGDNDMGAYGGVLFYRGFNQNVLYYIAIDNITDSLPPVELLYIKTAQVPSEAREEDLEGLYVLRRQETTMSVYELEDLLDLLSNDFSYYTPTPFNQASYSEILGVLARHIEDNIDKELLELWDPQILEDYLNEFRSPPAAATE